MRGKRASSLAECGAEGLAVKQIELDIAHDHSRNGMTSRDHKDLAAKLPAEFDAQHLGGEQDHRDRDGEFGGRSEVTPGGAQGAERATLALLWRGWDGALHGQASTWQTAGGPAWRVTNSGYRHNTR